MKIITSDTLISSGTCYFTQTLGSRGGPRVDSTEERSICLNVQQRENNSMVSKNVSRYHMNVSHSLQSSATSDLPTRAGFFTFFFLGLTHRPRALALESLPEMQPCFSLPISQLGFLTLRWRRAPNKIWVRLESPNIRIQYLSHNRLQVANCHSSGVFFWLDFTEAESRVQTCPLHPHFLLEHMTT